MITIKERSLHISDIHGEYDKFMQLLEYIQYNPKKDQLVLHGDYVDRGHQNIKMLLKVKELRDQGAIVLMGNHEEMIGMALREMVKDKYRIGLDTQLYIKCGGLNTYNELIKLDTQELNDLLNFVQNLPIIYCIDKYICVHAGVNAIVPLERNDSDDFLWARENFLYNKAYDGKTVIFGHTPTQNITYRMDNSHVGIWFDPTYKDKIGIDCGSIFGGKLACLELPTMKEFYV